MNIKRLVNKCRNVTLGDLVDSAEYQRIDMPRIEVVSEVVAPVTDAEYQLLRNISNELPISARLALATHLLNAK